MAGYFGGSVASSGLTQAQIVESGSSTGCFSGGILSVGTPNTTFSITDGRGVVSNGSTLTEVSWSGQTNLTTTYLASDLISFVSINSAGAVVQQATSWTAAERRSNIILGVLVHVNNINLDTVNNQQQPSSNISAQLTSFMQDMGFINGKSLLDNVFSTSGADLTIDKSAGDIIGAGIGYSTDVNNPHVLTLPALTDVSFQYRFQDGTNGVTGTVIDPNIWDVGGTSTAVATNKFTVQRLYSFTSNNVKVQPGQTEFNSLAAALDALPNSDVVVEPSIAANGLLRGFLVVQQGTTDLTDPSKAVFRQADRFGQLAI